jgi:hypothetical protein
MCAMTTELFSRERKKGLVLNSGGPKCLSRPPVAKLHMSESTFTVEEFWLLPRGILRLQLLAISLAKEGPPEEAGGLNVWEPGRSHRERGAHTWILFRN